MNYKTFTCICCPRGCLITIDNDFNVTGNTCPRGKDYALNELKNPLRTVTSSIVVSNRKNTLVSIKTSKPIPKEKIFALMNVINSLSIKAPCKVGDLVIKSPLGLDTDLVITKNID